MGDGETPRNPADKPYKDAPQGLRDFLNCVANSYTWAAGEARWIPGWPVVRFEPGAASSHAILLFDFGALEVGAELSVGNGQLIGVLASLAKYRESAKAAAWLQSFVENANAWLLANGKEFGTMPVSTGELSFTKHAIEKKHETSPSAAVPVASGSKANAPTAGAPKAGATKAGAPKAGAAKAGAPKAGTTKADAPAPEPGANLDPPALPTGSLDEPRRDGGPVVMSPVGAADGPVDGASGASPGVTLVSADVSGRYAFPEPGSTKDDPGKRKLIAVVVAAIAIGAGGLILTGTLLGKTQPSSPASVASQAAAGATLLGSAGATGSADVTQLPTSPPASVSCDPAPALTIALSGAATGPASPACVPVVVVPNRGSPTPFCRLAGIPNHHNQVAGQLVVAMAFVVGASRYELNLAYVADERDPATHGVLPATVTLANGSSAAGGAEMQSWPATEALPAGDMVGWQPGSGTVTFDASGSTGSIDLDFTAKGQTVHVAGGWTVAGGCPG